MDFSVNGPGDNNKVTRQVKISDTGKPSTKKTVHIGKRTKMGSEKD